MHLPVFRIALLSALVFLAGCSSMPDEQLDQTPDGRLPPCPSSPNCVSSDAPSGDFRHAIAALDVRDDPQAGWGRLLSHLESDSSCTIVEQREDFIRAEARTRILRFVDDLLFELRPNDGVIAMRSASRLGYSDLGKNRKRLETVRAAVER